MPNVEQKRNKIYRQKLKELRDRISWKQVMKACDKILWRHVKTSYEATYESSWKSYKIPDKTCETLHKIQPFESFKLFLNFWSIFKML